MPVSTKNSHSRFISFNVTTVGVFNMIQFENNKSFVVDTSRIRIMYVHIWRLKLNKKCYMYKNNLVCKFLSLEAIHK